jgi:hypothetical protein
LGKVARALTERDAPWLFGRCKSIVNGVLKENDFETKLPSSPPMPCQLMSDYVSHLTLADLRHARERLVHRLGTTEAQLHRRLDLFMAPDQLRHLPSFGIEVANHTLTHVHCRSLDDAELETEIVGSKRLLEDLLGAAGQPVRAFAFP